MITLEPASAFEFQILLDLADDPRHDVKTTTDTAHLGVVIPEELHDRFVRYMSLPSTPVEQEQP